MIDDNLRECLRQLDPGLRPLRRWLRQHVDDAMLERIAKADYGADSDEHLERLKPLRDGGVGLDPSSWYPSEVLELTRWTSPPPDDRRGHTARLFACTLLLEADQDPKLAGYLLGQTDTLAQFLDSCVALGPEVQRLGLQLLAWRCAEWLPPQEDLAFFAVAALMLAALTVTAEQEPLIPRLAGLAEKAVEEQENSPVGRMGAAQSHWLLGLTTHTLKASVWLRLAREILLRPRPGLSRPSAEAVERIGLRMTEGQSAV